MSMIKWDDSYFTGIEQFDAEHKHLFGLLNTAYDDFIDGSQRETLGTVLDELADYATYHFANEEHWMDEFNYPDLDKHREEHEKFRLRLRELVKDYHMQKNSLSLELLTFLTNWLINHINKTDADYGRHAMSIKPGL